MNVANPDFDKKLDQELDQKSSHMKRASVSDSDNIPDFKVSPSEIKENPRIKAINKHSRHHKQKSGTLAVDASSLYTTKRSDLEADENKSNVDDEAEEI